jgi:hypothetical protein
MLLQKDKPTLQERLPQILTEEVDQSLTLKQNEKLYSLYINIILGLYCEYSRSMLNLSIFRNPSEIKAEINQYIKLSEDVADQILKQRRIFS